MRRLLVSAGLLASAVLGGCASGSIYTHTIQPLSTNFQDTPVGPQRGRSDIKDLNLNFIYVRVMWNGNDISGTARKHGIQKVYYADREVLSVLGIWNQDWVHIYGT